MSALAALDDALSNASERATPVLVKEVRVALRGRWFKVAFALTLGTATLASIAFAAWSVFQDEPPNGAAYAMLMLGCLTLGVHLILPFSAMLSMQAETDEDTLEMLQLTRLGASRVVLGKILGALVQSVVLYGAVVPFLAFAFLLPGVGIGAILVAVLFSFAYCAALCSIGAFFGTFGRQRLVRVLAMAGFGLFLFQSAQLGVLFGVMAFGASISPVGGSVLLGSFSVTLVIVYGAALAFAFACARVAHPEENRSTPMRLVVSATVLVGIAWAWVTRDAQSAAMALAIALALAGLPIGLAATEHEGLPRAVRVPRSVPAAILASPWLPGGGRGVLFLLVHFAAAIATIAAITWVTGATGVELFQLVVACLFGAIYVLAPCAVLARFARTTAHRILLRVCIALFALGSLVVGLILSRGTPLDPLEDLGIAMNPFALAEGITSSGHVVAGGAFLTTLSFFALALIANLRRTVRGVAEVVSASRRRR